MTKFRFFVTVLVLVVGLTMGVQAYAAPANDAASPNKSAKSEDKDLLDYAFDYAGSFLSNLWEGFGAGDTGGGGHATKHIWEQQMKQQADLRKQIQNSVPQACIDDPTKFGNCPLDYFRLDYVPKKTYGPLTPVDSIEQSLYAAWNMILDFGVNCYVHFWAFVLDTLEWGIDTPFYDAMIDPLKDTINVAIKWIWLPLWGLAVLIAMANTLYYIYRRRHYEVYERLLSVTILSCLSVAIFYNFPDVVKQVHNTMKNAGKNTLAGMLSHVSEEEISKTIEDLPENRAKQYIKSTEIKPEESAKEAIKRIKDEFWKTIVVEPVWVLEFGSVENGKTYFPQLVQYGADNKEFRREWLTGVAKTQFGYQTSQQFINPETGMADPKYPGFKLMTSDGLGKRSLLFLSMASTGLMIGLMVLWLTFWAIWFVAKMVARMVLGFARSIASIMIGWRELVEWAMSVVVTAAMNYFILIFLGVVVILWSGVSQIDISKLGSNWVLGFLGKALFQIILTLALYFEFKVALNIRIPLPGGGSVGFLDDSDQSFGRWLSRTAGMVKSSALAGWNAAKQLAIGGIATAWRGARSGALALAGRPDYLKPGLLKEFAQWQKSRKEAEQAREAMQKMGYNPDSLQSRQLFLNHMTRQGQKQYGLEVLQKLGPIDPNKQSPPTTLRSRLSPEARDLYKRMKDAGKDPLNAHHRSQWLQERPNDGRVMEELNQYANMPMWKRMESAPPLDWSVVPPEKPAENTPEYDLWKNYGYEFRLRQFEKTMDAMERERIEAYQKELRAYHQLPKIKQWFTPKPKLPKPPREEDVLKRLREQSAMSKGGKDVGA